MEWRTSARPLIAERDGGLKALRYPKLAEFGGPSDGNAALPR